MTIEKQKGRFLHVKVQPRARKAGVQQLDTNTYKVAVTASPTKGEANRQVVELLSSRLGIAKSCVKIIRGHKSRKKYILVEGASDGDIGDGNV